MDTNRRELLLQKEMIRGFVNAPDLIRVYSQPVRRGGSIRG